MIFDKHFDVDRDLFLQFVLNIKYLITMIFLCDFIFERQRNFNRLFKMFLNYFVEILNREFSSFEMIK